MLFCLLLPAVQSADFIPQLVSSATYSITDTQTVASLGGTMSSLDINHSLPSGITGHSYPPNSEVVQDEYGNYYLHIREQKTRSSYQYVVQTTAMSTRSHISSLPSAYGPPDHNGEYLSSDRLVDAASPQIRGLALSIAENSTSQFEQVALLAIYVNNKIEYDASLVGRELSASDILKSPRGVCTEYTTLFISLARSIGIPSRYVNGYAYSDKYDSWLGHSWAEVYLGQWVGVDPTWLQVGDIDATHISSVRKPGLGFSTSSVTALVYPPSARLTFDQQSGSGGLKADNIRLVDSSSDAPEGGYSISLSSGKLPQGGKFVAWVELPSSEYRVVPMSLLSCKGDYSLASIGSEEKYAITMPGATSYVIWEGEVSDSLPDSYRFTCPATLNSPYLENSAISINITTADKIEWPALIAFIEDPHPSAGSMQGVAVPYLKQFAGQKITLLSNGVKISSAMKEGGVSFVFPAGFAGRHRVFVFGPFGDPITLDYTVERDTGAKIDFLGFEGQAYEGDKNQLNFQIFPSEAMAGGESVLDIELGGQRLASEKFNLTSATNISIPFTPSSSGEGILVAHLYNDGYQLASTSSVLSVFPSPGAKLYRVQKQAGKLKATFLVDSASSLSSLTLKVGELEVPFKNGQAVIVLAPGNYSASLTWQEGGREHSRPFSFELAEQEGQSFLPLPSLPQNPMSQSTGTPAQGSAPIDLAIPLYLMCPVAIILIIIPLAFAFTRRKKGL